MLSCLAAARQAALGSAVNSLAPNAAAICHPCKSVLEAAGGAQGELFQSLALSSSSEAAGQAKSVESMPSPAHLCIDSSSAGDRVRCAASAIRADLQASARPRVVLSSPFSSVSIHGGRTLLQGMSAPHRLYHTSRPAGMAAMPVAVPPTPSAAGAGAGFQARRGPQLSTHAREFARRFFQLVNTGAEAETSPEAKAAATNNSVQAIRLLLAWLEEGRATLAEERRQQQQQAGGTEQPAPTSSSAGAGAGGVGVSPLVGGVAEAYRLDQGLINRAMDVLWRLYNREDLLVRGAGGRGREAQPPPSSSDGSMELRELLTAAESLAAAAPAMGLEVRRQHYDLLLELYGKLGMQDERARRGMAQRMLAVRQLMVQQVQQVSQGALYNILSTLRRDPQVDPSDALSSALRIIDRDLPVISPASSAVSAMTGPGSAGAPLIRPLERTLHFLMRDAVRQSNWSAYQKLEAVLVSRTRTVPPYEVVLDLLSYAAAAGKGALALGALAQIQQLEASQKQPLSSSGPAGGRRGGPASYQDDFLDPAVAVEMDAVRGMLKLGVQQRDEQMAEQSYQRLRTLYWRDEDGPTSRRILAILKAAEAKKAAREAAAAKAAKRKEEGAGAQDKEEEEEVGKDVDTPEQIAALKEALEAKPVPSEATLVLLELALARRNWKRVMDLVGELAQLHTLSCRSNGRLRRCMWERMGVDRRVSAYDGLSPLSEVLIQSEDDTVAYYSELLRRVAEAAASGTAAAPFGGSYVPYGPPLRAAAARRDLTSVAEIIKQMKGLGCPAGSDSYAALIEATLKAGKPERVAGLLGMMADEKLHPNMAVWQVQLAAATEARDAAALLEVADRALVEADKKLGSLSKRGVAEIDVKLVDSAIATAESLGDSRAAATLQLLHSRIFELRQEEERHQAREDAREGRSGPGGDDREHQQGWRPRWNDRWRQQQSLGQGQGQDRRQWTRESRPVADTEAA